MEDNYFGNYGVQSGYNQVAPGRDMRRFRQPGQPGRPRTNPINDAIAGPAPVPQPAPDEVPTFAGAQQTTGAPPSIPHPNRRYMQAPGGIADVSAAVTGRNEAAGYDVDKWNTLSPETQEMYRVQGGAPSSYDSEPGGSTGTAPAPIPNPPTSAQPKYDTSKWDTDGYQAPGYIAENVGTAPGGWDGTKWADPNNQHPKYVVGRILTQRDNRDPAQRAQTIADIQKAYPGTTYDGGDKITMPDGGVVDIFGQSKAGLWTPAWQPVTGPGGKPLPQESAPINPAVMTNAITGPAQQQEASYSDRLRQRIMAALTKSPELLTIAKQTYGI